MYCSSGAPTDTTLMFEPMECLLHDGFYAAAAAGDCPAAEAKKHKLKNLVPAPRSFFMDVKCPGCFTITTVFSHAQTVVICQGCTTVLCQPTGGKARLTEGCSFRRK
ncbi:ribosomal protein S27-domain-containing protein [Xylariaceae sp. AK1471]|nr:ribosomal protein S27-domain-containing protein [Xylariaceae sp. AK1471]